MYKIVFSKGALKSLNKIPKEYQIQIKKKLEQLSFNPFRLDLRKLSTMYTATHRLRIGNYRLFLKIGTTEKTAQIDEIERRTSQTYH